MPYRLDVPHAAHDAFDRLVDLGALDAERSDDGSVAALMPDSVAPDQVAIALRVTHLEISPARARDAGSVWVLKPRPIWAGRVRITPADSEPECDAIRLIDASAFGTGLHPTTSLCLETLGERLRHGSPDAVLDVGTGSGVLALGALKLGVRRAVGLDIDADALRVAADNARLNGLGERLTLVRGGPEALRKTWPLVIANVLAAPLIAMAPLLVRRVGHAGELVLSGVAQAVEPDVSQAYQRWGMRRVSVTSRSGWVALVFQASW